MKFLKSYTGALVVLAAVIVLSAPLGCLRSVNAQRAQGLELFAQGGQGDGGSVASDLQDRICLLYTSERISVADITFGYDERGAMKGLCRASKLLMITTRGLSLIHIFSSRQRGFDSRTGHHHFSVRMSL